jgi:hypothetical protein
MLWLSTFNEDIDLSAAHLYRQRVGPEARNLILEPHPQAPEGTGLL